MPIVFCPPSVSALKARIARYFSGSRAALVGVGDVNGLAEIGGEVLAFARLVFVFVSDRWQAPAARHSMVTSKSTKSEARRTGFRNLEPDRAVRPVWQAAVFISFSEELERGGSVNKKGALEGIRRIARASQRCNANDEHEVSTTSR